MELVKRRHNLRIGERTAEMLKLMLGSALAGSAWNALPASATARATRRPPDTATIPND